MLLFAQDNSEKEQTTYERFISPKGSIIKLCDYALDDLLGHLGSGLFKLNYRAEAVIRKVTVNGDSDFYLLLTYYRGENLETKAFITYDNIVELLRAWNELKSRAQDDTIGDAKYSEQKFKTKFDYLSEGYYIEKKEKKKGVYEENKVWFLDLDTRFSNSTMFFDEPEAVTNCFKSAIDLIDQLRAK